MWRRIDYGSNSVGQTFEVLMSTHETADVQSASSENSQTTDAPASGGSAHRVQMKSTLAGMSYEEGAAFLAPSGAGAVQAKGGDTSDAVHSAAAHGISGGGGAMPHGDKIQAAFGHHDISGISAHVGGKASEGAAAMGAEAYATGNSVAFGSGPSLHTAAHEAAHIVQQRAGVSLKGGVGQAGDTYEQHADAVADKVVAGESAVELLDQMAPAGGGGGVQQKAVQHRLWTGATKERDAQLVDPGGIGAEALAAMPKKGTVAVGPVWELTIAAVKKALGASPDLFDAALQARVRSKFDAWVATVSTAENALKAEPGVRGDDNKAMAKHTENRVYASYDNLAAALIHESAPAYADRLAVEAKLARQVLARPEYTAALRAVVTAVGAKMSEQDMAALSAVAAESRYGDFGQLKDCKAIFAGGGDVTAMWVLLDEVTNTDHIRSSESFRKHYQSLRKEHGDTRNNGHTVREDNEWVKSARALGVPLMAGPSGTTSRILALGQSAGIGGTDLYKVGWVGFAFYNGMWRGQSGTHRLHEVMAATKLYCGAAFEYYPAMTEL